MTDYSEKMQEIVDRLNTPVTTYEDYTPYEDEDPKKGIVDRQPAIHEPADTHFTKNYGDFGGDKWVVNGEFVDGSKAVVADDANVATLIAALKTAGVIAPNELDDVDATEVVTTAALPTDEDRANVAKIKSIDVANDVITITLSCKVDDLEDADHGESWGTHKWLGFGVDTGLESIVGVTFQDTTMATLGTKYTMTSADASEASELGLSAGQFVLYIKAEDVGYKQGKKFMVLGAPTYADKKITIAIVEEPIELIEDSVEIGG